MDLRTNEEVMGVQNRYSAEYRMFNVKETFEETDIKGNNNLFNSLKTEALGDFGHDPGSCYKVKCSKRRKMEIEDSLFSYSSFKKAMDLRTHNRTLDGGNRTIFEDAEYFAMNHCYKLLPITFEQVDETIIQSEHNYSLFSLTSESEAEEDCSRMMDYSQVMEKNYKRRRTKFREGVCGEELVVEGGAPVNEQPPRAKEEIFTATAEHPIDFFGLEPENFAAVQPLDLSAAPPVREEKTEPFSCKPPSVTEEEEEGEAFEVLLPDSDKENASSGTRGIRVTITRPDEKENYEPCDMFLNDMARLVPWLIDKDCFEVDILDKTCDCHEELRKHRLYYVISESTWRSFQGASERVILTSDHSLGQPLRKPENGETPTYLVFDQFSLAKCLADYCREIGGCFEYTCVEEEEKKWEKEEDSRETDSGEKTEDARQELEREECGNVVEETEGTAVKTAEEKPETKEKIFDEASLKVAETMKDVEEEEKMVSKEVVQKVEKVQEVKKVEKAQVVKKVEKAREVKKVEKLPEVKEIEKMQELKELKEAKGQVKKVKEVRKVKKAKGGKEVKKMKETNECLEKRISECVVACYPVSKRKILLESKKAKTKTNSKEERRNDAKAVTKGNETKKREKNLASTEVSSKQEPNKSRITTRSKSISESETSQKSDERVRREERKRGGRSIPKAEPPVKLKRAEALPREPLTRATKARKVSEKAKTTKSPAAKGGKKEVEATKRTSRPRKVNLRKKKKKKKVEKRSKGRKR